MAGVMGEVRLSAGLNLVDDIVLTRTLHNLGWQVVRWMWSDLYQRNVIRDRVLRAFVRAA